jgi:hypothetical protein
VRQSLSEESIEALQEIFDDDEGLARQVLVESHTGQIISYWSNNLIMVKYRAYPPGATTSFFVASKPRVE